MLYNILFFLKLRTTIFTPFGCVVQGAFIIVIAHALPELAVLTFLFVHSDSFYAATFAATGFTNVFTFAFRMSSADAFSIALTSSKKRGWLLQAPRF